MTEITSDLWKDNHGFHEIINIIRKKNVLTRKLEFHMVYTTARHIAFSFVRKHYQQRATAPTTDTH
jgi:hypothetical protein